MHDLHYFREHLSEFEQMAARRGARIDFDAFRTLDRERRDRVTAVERLGKKRLAYEIKDAREGTYVVMQFKGGPNVSKELDRLLKLHEDVLRALIVRLDAKMLTHMAALAAAAPPQPQNASFS